MGELYRYEECHLYCGYTDMTTAYTVSQGGMFVVDISNGSIQKSYTNINGLISIELSAIGLDNHNRLWIGANDGSLMIYDYVNSTFKYIYDINSCESNRSINYFKANGDVMYIATGYGIHKVSTTTFTFVDAPYKQLGSIGQSRVNALTVYNDQLFAATEGGVAYASLSNPNLNNPASWTTYNTTPLNAKVKTIESFDNKVFAGSETGLAYYDGANWNAYPNATLATGNVKFIKGISSNLYAAVGNSAFSAPASDLSQVSQLQGNANYTVIAPDNNLNPVFGTSDNGIYAKVGNANYSFLFPNGPYRNSFDDISIDEGEEYFGQQADRMQQVSRQDFTALTELTGKTTIQLHTLK